MLDMNPIRTSRLTTRNYRDVTGQVECGLNCWNYIARRV